MRTIAVDWSGAASGARRHIWLAEVEDGRLTRLESGRSRNELTVHLIAEARRNPELVVGLDFAFSFPGWFLETLSIASALDLWRRAAEEGEIWLASCEAPFWGRPGRGRPELASHFRKTELDAQTVAGTRPKSVFQIGGAGAVGTGSIRGMPALARLAEVAASGGGRDLSAAAHGRGQEVQSRGARELSAGELPRVGRGSSGVGGFVGGRARRSGLGAGDVPVPG